MTKLYSTGKQCCSRIKTLWVELVASLGIIQKNGCDSLDLKNVFWLKNPGLIEQGNDNFHENNGRKDKKKSTKKIKLWTIRKNPLASIPEVL